MTWKGQPLNFYTGLYERSEKKAPLMTSANYVVCNLALSMGLSKNQFFDKFDDLERAQLIATYQTKNEIAWVQIEYPLQAPKRGK